MHWIDWIIIGALLAVLCGVLYWCQRYVKSTADFLAAGRCARRYLLTITSGIAGIGAISIVGSFEQSYAAGFTPVWWGFLTGPIGLVIAITGFVYYRLRETRCLTMAQFFEVRYSRNFRVFSTTASFRRYQSNSSFISASCRKPSGSPASTSTSAPIRVCLVLPSGSASSLPSSAVRSQSC